SLRCRLQFLFAASNAQAFRQRHRPAVRPSAKREVSRPMKAATIARYGSPGVVAVRDVEAPVPEPDQVLVRVHAATVNRTDCGELLHPTLIRLLTGGGSSRRNILGMDFAGTIGAVRTRVTRSKP